MKCRRCGTELINGKCSNCTRNTTICRRCGSVLIDEKCPNCTKDIVNNNGTKNIKSPKKKSKLIIFIIILLFLTLGVSGYYFYTKYQKDKEIKISEAKREEIIEILNRPSGAINGNEILEETPSEDIYVPKIDLSYSQENIVIDENEKSKSIFTISNKILNEAIEVNAELILSDVNGLVLKGIITNITNGFDFPKLTLRALSYDSNLDSKPLLQHNKYFLIEDEYTFEIKSGETKEFAMKIRDKNTKYLKLGLKTGDLFIHSEENAVSVNNDIMIPVFLTDKYNENNDTLPFKFAIVDKEGNVSKVYEHKNLIKEYEAKKIGVE